MVIFAVSEGAAASLHVPVPTLSRSRNGTTTIREAEGKKRR